MRMKNGVVDRIEDGYCVILHDDQTTSTFRVNKNQTKFQEGDRIFLNCNGKWEVDKELTRVEKHKTEQLTRDFFGSL